MAEYKWLGPLQALSLEKKVGGRPMSDFAQYSLCVEDTTPGGFGSLSFATHGTLPEARGAWRRAIRDYQQDGWRRLQRIPRELRELLAARGSVLWEYVAYMARRKDRALVYLIAHGAEER